MDPERAREVLLGALDDAGLETEDVGDDRWMTMLSGQWKRTIPVMLHLGERTLRVTSLFCADPDQGHEEVYRILLRRNQRTHGVHFALDDEGDVILTGGIALDALDEEAVDHLLGAVLATADETYNQVLRAGFADYIDREQRWRAANELPANPVSEAP
ncbi:MAG: YbjN domain-containing protein [Actinobacteria bacterium]|nr:YbjN domain-containing protein [Actinomycetota bacterium]